MYDMFSTVIYFWLIFFYVNKILPYLTGSAKRHACCFSHKMIRDLYWNLKENTSKYSKL